MEYQNSVQIGIKEIRDKHFDLIIAASGFEKRCNTLFLNYSFNANKKVAFAFSEKKNESNHKCNDEFFISKGFELLTISGEESKDIDVYLNLFLSSLEKDTIELLIDYSSMTRIWYAKIINFFASDNVALKNVSIYFSYTPTSFNLPKKNCPVRFAGSLMQFEPVRANNKPLALIVGLGIDQDKASYLIKKINPVHLTLMYADPAFDKKYVETVLRTNRKLIDSIEIRNLLNYPLADNLLTSQILTDLCLILRMRYNVIIAPLGPKVFSLCSLLFSTNYPDVDVWRVSSGAGNTIYDRIPSNVPVILKAKFVNDEHSY